VEHDAFDRGYVAVNRLFADAVADEVQARGGRALVMLHDYHFYLVTEQVRRRCPQALLSHFVHIPWPGPDIWGMLPAAIREQLLRGLLGADVIGFQTRRFARNFLRCCQDLLGLDVDTAASTVTADGRTVRVRHYPISVDPAALDRVAASPAAAEHARSLTEAFHGDDRKLVLRVDRTDPSKYVVRGFLAFGTLLDEHPELEGRVSFLALLQPSRTDVPEYSDYIAQIGAVVAEVNARHTKEGRQPIDMRMAEDYPLVVGAYTVCDVLMVNAVADGMNLVAKEVVLVNTRDAVLALSETAGAFEELRDHVVPLQPVDVAQMADALHHLALTMLAGERRARRAAAAKHVRTNDVAAWLTAQLIDLQDRRYHRFRRHQGRQQSDPGPPRAALSLDRSLITGARRER
jgi:trehalose 6-phosphate synthase